MKSNSLFIISIISILLLIPACAINDSDAILLAISIAFTTFGYGLILKHIENK